jgi:protein-disulfide isomerase
MALRARRQHISILSAAAWRRWMRLAGVFPLAVAALTLALPPPAQADDLTSAQRKAVDVMIHDYLLNHPDVLIEAIRKAEDKMKADQDHMAVQALQKRHQQVFDDPASPVGGNPHGDVTLVEFFDYQCPYCKEVEPSLEKLTAQDHGLRVVFKEFPVLGPASITAARAALAAQKQSKYDAFHVAMMAAKGRITDQTVYAVAGSVGLDLTRLKHDMADPAVAKQIKANLDLADALGITGTPAFIIGDRIIPGAVDLDTLKQDIADARGK